MTDQILQCEPATATERREALHCNPDPELCDCQGSGSYQDATGAWHDCPHHGPLFDETACRECGCTDSMACPGGCCWVEADLCSNCAPAVVTP